LAFVRGQLRQSPIPDHLLLKVDPATIFPDPAVLGIFRLMGFPPVPKVRADHGGDPAGGFYYGHGLAQHVGQIVVSTFEPLDLVRGAFVV
jgi:hypothetical protein